MNAAKVCKIRCGSRTFPFIFESQRNQQEIDVKNEKNEGKNTLFLKKSRKIDLFIRRFWPVFWFGRCCILCSSIWLSNNCNFGNWWLCGHLVIWSFVKIENGCGKNRHYNIKIYFYIIMSRKCVFQIENDKWPNDHLDRFLKEC